MIYKIIKSLMEWDTSKHDCILLQVMEMEGDQIIRTFPYAARKDDENPLAVFLWNEAMKYEDIIEKPYLDRIIDGELSVPTGYTLINNKLYNDYEEKQKALYKIDNLLNDLYSARSIIRAENNAEYAEERKEIINKLLSVENQEGFPYEIDWSFLQ